MSGNVTMKGAVRRAINRAIRPSGFSLVRVAQNGDGADAHSRPWDATFRAWITKAEADGVDPNQLGDVAWNDDALRRALEQFYLPLITPDSIVVELGPGTGRLTRHVIGRCKQMLLVDYSQFVRDFLERYFAGRGAFRTIQIDRPGLPECIADSSVDVVIANGVFEHLDPEETLWFLEAFYRVLKRGGRVAFNFDNLIAEEGIPWLRQYRAEPGSRCIFRFYSPDMMTRLAEAAGFDVDGVTTSESRFAFVELRKPERRAGCEGPHGTTDRQFAEEWRGDEYRDDATDPRR